MDEEYSHPLPEDAFSLDPKTEHDRTQLNRLLKAKFWDYLESKSEVHCQAYVKGGCDFGRLDADTKSAVLGLFDKFIVDQAATIGVRVLFGSEVLARMLEWEKGVAPADDLFVKLGNALSLYAKVSRGEAQRSLDDPRLYQFRKDLKAELDQIRRAIKSLFGRTRIEIDPFLKHFGKLTANRANPYERLSANSNDFGEFVKETWESGFESWLRGRSPTTSDIVNRFIAWDYGYKPSSARKRISSLGSRRRKR